MGQAAYDAHAEHFRNHTFYDENSKSPFLMVQEAGSKLYRLDKGCKPVRLGDQNWVIDPATYPREELTYSATIDEIEDYYISLAPVRPVDYPRSIYSINAQGSVHGAYNRRGLGWIVLMNTSRFNRILASMDEQQMKIWENVFSEKERLKIGRWSLAANKVDRCQHIWVADHLPDDETITVYRDIRLHRKDDGFAIMETENGFLYPEQDQEDYILRWQYCA